MTDPFVSPEPTALTRQTERLAGAPALYQTSHERLAVELAMGMDSPENIFAAYNFTPDQAMELMESPPFKVLLTRVATEIRENGVSFKAKIKAIAEDLLPHMHDIATDPLQSAAVRADIGKWAAKLAGHEPSVKGDVSPGSGGFNLSITFAGQAPQAIITGHEPLTIENGA